MRANESCASEPAEGAGVDTGAGETPGEATVGGRVCPGVPGTGVGFTGVTPDEATGTPGEATVGTPTTGEATVGTPVEHVWTLPQAVVLV